MDVFEIETGLLVCISGPLLGLVGSTLWVLNTTGVIKLFGLMIILFGIGACGYMMSSKEPSEEQKTVDFEEL